MDLEISPQEVKNKIDNKEDFIFLDVREESEYKTSHIKGTILVPIGELDERLSEMDNKKEVIAHCHHGYRSMQAAMFLRRLGYKAKSMKGGIALWSKEIDKTVPLY